MSTDRCGYTHHANRFPALGAVTCWRPTYDDRDRCVWHADEAAKPPATLRELSPAPGERLDGAVLRGVALDDSDLLADAVLVDADCSGADFEGASLAGADLRAASLTEVRAIDADLRDAVLEEANFDGATLRGATLSDADLEDADLSGARVGRETEFDDVVNYERRLQATADPDRREELFDAATWVYRELQRTARANALFRDVERYYYREKDLRRRVEWRRGNHARGLLMALSRWIMGYGRNPWRVLWTSALVVVVCAVLFPVVGELTDTAVAAEPVTYSLAVPPEQSPRRVATVLWRSLYFSVVTFGTLGYGDVSPVGAAARALAAVETLVGFALTALLISVLIRRGSWI